MDRVPRKADPVHEDGPGHQDEIAEGTWWAVGGLLVGALVAGLAGGAGARTARASRAEHTVTRRRSRS